MSCPSRPNASAKALNRVGTRRTTCDAEKRKTASRNNASWRGQFPFSTIRGAAPYLTLVARLAKGCFHAISAQHCGQSPLKWLVRSRTYEPIVRQWVGRERPQNSLQYLYNSSARGRQPTPSLIYNLQSHLIRVAQERAEATGLDVIRDTQQVPASNSRWTGEARRPSKCQSHNTTRPSLAT